MAPIGCKVTDLTAYWCPNCGTFRSCEADIATPTTAKVNAGLLTACEAAMAWLDFNINNRFGEPQIDLAQTAIRNAAIPLAAAIAKAKGVGQ